MKRNIPKILLALFLVLFIPFVSVTAEEANERKPILDIIAESERGIIPSDDIIYDKTLYADELADYDFSDVFIFRCYSIGSGSDNICNAFKAAKYLPGKTTVNKAVSYSVKDQYVIMDEKPFVVGAEYQEDDGSYVLKKYDNPYYEMDYISAIEDIRTNAVYDSKLNPENVRYTDVICFYGAPYGSLDSGEVVYYISGDNNSLVYYYPNYDSEAIQFTLLDFKTYATKYDEFKNTPKYKQLASYNGAAYEFLDYLKEYYPEMAKGSTVPNPDVSYPDEENSATSSDKNASGIRPWVLVVCIVGSFVLGAIAAILIKNKKKQ